MPRPTQKQYEFLLDAYEYRAGNLILEMLDNPSTQVEDRLVKVITVLDFARRNVKNAG